MNLKYVFGMALTALMVMPSCKQPAAQQNEQASAKKEICIQLYSVRDLLQDSPIDSLLPKLAAMGYTGVEAAGYNDKDGTFYGKTPEEFKEVVEANGMAVLSSHVSHNLTEEELKKGDFTPEMDWWKTAVTAHKAAGMKYIGNPWIGPQKSIKDLQLYCDYLNAIGKLCADNGIKFGYHNHSYEFEKVEDQVMYDYMLTHTDPNYVFFEMDVYWVMRGAGSPVAYFKQYPGRFKLLHIKDEAELGQSGMVGFDAIFNNIKTAGTENIIVEVERYTMPVLESVKESIDYLKNAPFVPVSYQN